MAETEVADVQLDEIRGQRALRLWPGLSLLALQWLSRFVVPYFMPEATPFGVLGGLAFGLGVVVWWAFFSRAAASERWGAPVAIAGGMGVAFFLVHESVRTGMMGLMLPVYALPGSCLALVAWAALTRSLAARPRRAAMLASILLSCLAWTLVRTGGFTGDLDQDFAWRWAETPEERLLALEDSDAASLGELPSRAGSSVVNPSSAAAAAGVAAITSASWPGFRGAGRDGVVHASRIASDWSASPPLLLWRRPVGPGWSSFAVDAGRLFTQEQRGEEELVACYRLDTGEPVWRHADAVRFWESNAGAGPRATPTLDRGRVYSFGATGILNALDAGDGTLAWSRDVAADTGIEVPTWGFSSSPLVVGELIVVAAAGKLAAYELAGGEPRWYGSSGAKGYSSPQLATIDGVAQLLLMNDIGATAVDPLDGLPLWEHAWPGEPVVQPALTAQGELLINSGDRRGLRRIAVSRAADGWAVQERWTTARLKPYFNDLVVHEEHAYGFDGSLLACIELAGGARQWKGGRYGHGQLLLLADQDLLLVLSEQGELALVSATPEAFTELARVPAIESKTWNHPVLVDDLLLVRNGEQMAAFRLPLAGD